MGRFYQSADSMTFPATPEKIFSLLTDWEVRNRWCPGIKVTWDGGSQAYVGQRVKFEKAFGITWTFRVTGLEPGRRMFFEYQEGLFRGRAALETAPEGNGTQATFYWMRVEPHGWVARLYFALGLGLKAHRRNVLKTFRKLAEYLEKND